MSKHKHHKPYRPAERMVRLWPTDRVIPESMWASPFEMGYGPDYNGHYPDFYDCTGVMPGPLTRKAQVRP
jgi:hypothetical protein